MLFRSLAPAFVVQLIHRLRDQDPRATPALRWLQERLTAQGTTSEAIVHDEHQRQGASNVTVRNIITSMRLLSDVDWREFFESVSLVDEALRAGSDFGAMDFPSRDLYRRAIEQLARGSNRTELEIAQAALSAAGKAVAGRELDPGYYLIAAGRRAFAATVGYRASVWSHSGRFNAAPGVGSYIGAIALITAVVLSVPLLALHAGGIAGLRLAALALLGLIPSIDAAVAQIGRASCRERV